MEALISGRAPVVSYDRVPHPRGLEWNIRRIVNGEPTNLFVRVQINYASRIVDELNENIAQLIRQFGDGA